LVVQPGKQTNVIDVVSCTQWFWTPAPFCPQFASVVHDAGEHQFPAQVAPLAVQSAFVAQGSPTFPLDDAQTNPEPPRACWQNVSVKGAQSLEEVQPGKHENVLPEFWMQWFAMPAVLEPQLVSAVPMHDWLHQEPWQVAGEVHGLQGEVVPVLQGSPTCPFVAAQIDPVAPLPIGWHVVPAYGKQSALLEHPGKQMLTLLPFCTQ
jgi:hypothetical protein